MDKKTLEKFCVVLCLLSVSLCSFFICRSKSKIKQGGCPMRRNRQRFFGKIAVTLWSLILITVLGCERSISVPTEFSLATNAPRLFPDYNGVTLPWNIAPINFRIDEEGTRFVTVVSGSRSPESLTLTGRTVTLPENRWRALLTGNTDGEIRFDIFTETERGWTKWPRVTAKISGDAIDPWVSYRLIEPGYEVYGRISLNQRSLENFDERPIIDNASVTVRTCVNCHHYQNRSGENFLFHSRGDFGGTTLAQNGQLRRLDTKRPDGNAAVYPAWHPTLPFIAFSTNRTRQTFHSASPNRIEVFDQFSDLLLYDIEKNEMLTVFKTREIFETFPSWSQDGTWLYYCAADLPSDLISHDDEANEDFVDTKDYALFKYNIRRIPFHAATRSFGEPETVIDAASQNQSAVHPRLSPDGRFLLYTVSNYGTFPIWHRESDLKMRDLTTGADCPTDVINSPETESWHTWDSSGRWIVFSSRRGDTLYTRLYFAHVDSDGNFSKPFLLPQKNPDENIYRLKSYNIPEMMTDPVAIPPDRVARAVRFETPEKVILPEGKGIEN